MTGCEVTVPPPTPEPVLSPTSILPPHCAFTPRTKNSARISKPLLLKFSYFFKLRKVRNSLSRECLYIASNDRIIGEKSIAEDVEGGGDSLI
jgi:hypothetical protein